MRHEVKANLSLSGVTAAQLRLLVQYEFFSGVAQAIQSLEAPRHNPTQKDWAEFISAVERLIFEYEPSSTEEFLILPGIYTQEVWAVVVALGDVNIRIGRELLLATGSVKILKTAHEWGFSLGHVLAFSELAETDQDLLKNDDACYQFHFGED